MACTAALAASLSWGTRSEGPVRVTMCMSLIGSPEGAAFDAGAASVVGDAAVVTAVDPLVASVLWLVAAVAGAALLGADVFASLPQPTASKVQATSAPKRAFLGVDIMFPHVESNRLNS